MSILILGLGVSGRAAADYFLKAGKTVFGLDDKAESLKELPDLQKLVRQGLVLVKDVPPHISLIVLSPGVPPKHPALQKGIPVIGEVELAAQRLINREWIGITGTNGKTTVTLFMDHLLKTAGFLSTALGNVGTPLITHESPPGEIIVAELSSYQLETLKTPVLKAAVLLNITPDHLDRYGTMECYARAKASIFACVKPEGTSIINYKTYKEWPHLFKGKDLQTFGYEKEADLYFDGEELFLEGKKVHALLASYKGVKTHDVENWMAAFLLGRVWGIEENVFLTALSTFKKPRHRIEKVGVFRGIHFFDDSKGTNIDATMRAVEAMQTPVVLIAGGVHKGFSYTSWKETFQGKVKSICAIGEAAPLIEKDLQESFSIVRCQTMEEAVREAAQIAQENESVLLSPGCASFDMFKDYAHRGEEFQRCVHNL